MLESFRNNGDIYKLQTIHDTINNPSIVGVEVEPYRAASNLAFQAFEGFIET